MNKRKNGDLQGTNELARWERGNLAFKANNRILALAFDTEELKASFWEWKWGKVRTLPRLHGAWRFFQIFFSAIGSLAENRFNWLPKQSPMWKWLEPKSDLKKTRALAKKHPKSRELIPSRSSPYAFHFGFNLLVMSSWGVSWVTPVTPGDGILRQAMTVKGSTSWSLRPALALHCSDHRGSMADLLRAPGSKSDDRPGHVWWCHSPHPKCCKDSSWNKLLRLIFNINQKKME